MTNVQQDVVYIPIRNGKFEYELNCDYEEMYKLIFLDEFQSAMWNPVKFFSEKGTINFTFYPMDENEQNQIKGGIHNTEYYAFSKDVQALDKEDERISQKTDSMQLQYITEHQTLVGYAILLEKIWAAIYYYPHYSREFDITPFVETYNTVYVPKFPEHPYTEQIQLLINSAESIKVGGQYIDFEVPDLEGNVVKLSEQIQGKMALIHFWATWCGACRQNGKVLIPVYEAYKDKGFTVVGIARATTAVKAAIEKDKYPWLNLVDMNDKENIWIKYELGNAGGGEFLVDENGVILAIGPTVEEVEKILKKRLK
ncbi:MAG: AhpC/TSA family protein [Prevotellaceae bacterium]|jgi:peroxiredoxin|nr:AhpC/TSA family protein [Prevotellaceae bacterium]